MTESTSKFGRWLRNKRNFYLYFVLGTGVPVAIIFIWMFGGLIASPFWVAFLAVISVLGSILVAFCMWHFFRWSFPSMRSEETDDAA